MTVRLLNQNDCLKIMEMMDKLPPEEKLPQGLIKNVITLRQSMFDNLAVMIGDVDREKLRALMVLGVPFFKGQKSLSLTYFTHDIEFLKKAVDEAERLFGDRYSKIEAYVNDCKSEDMLKFASITREI